MYTGHAPIGIVGIDGLGTLANQFAKALSHRVLAIDYRAQGRAFATEFRLKADLVIDSGSLLLLSRSRPELVETDWRLHCVHRQRANYRPSGASISCALMV